MFRQINALFSTAKKPAKKQPKTLQYEELEQRVLFSADFVPGLDNIAVEEQALVEDIGSDFQVEREAAPETVEQTAAEARWELVIINEDVADYDQLIAGLQGSNNNRIIEEVVLDADRDGIEQVSEILAERSNVAAVHFITHGSDGQINLGNNRLTSTTLAENSDAVAGWGKALTETGDILFYGCNIAAASDGQTLLDDIAELTGADVVASDDATGHELLGGDWDLEYSSGSIESSVALSESVQQNWAADLATATTGDDTLSIGVIGETFDALADDDSAPIPLAAERTDDHTFTLNHTNIDSTDFNDRITSFVVGDPGGDRPGSQDGIHVIMIDTTLAQYQELVDAAEEGTHVIEYNGETESAEAVLARAVDYATNNQETIDSISIMSHGLSGEFKLGNEWIGSDDLADHAEAWHALDEVMNDGGNIYLYGCNVAEDSEAGQALLDGLAEVTHADVFASNDVTGASGDWDLEAASTGDEAELERGLDTNLDDDELADYADALADYSGAGWSGAQTFIDGAISFTLEVTGGGTIDWSYDGTTDTLTITDNDGTSAATSVTITDNNGGLNVDSITTDMKLGSLTCNTDIVTLTMGKAISNTIVGGGSGTISSLIITDTLKNETVNIYANISSVISTSQFWGGDFNVSGDVGSIDMTGSPGKLRDSSITVNGDLDSINVQKYEGTVSIVVTNVTGQFDMVGDYVYSNNFTTATYFSFDGSSVITDANEAPTVSLSNLTATLSEDTDTTAAIKVADITLSDDGLGTNNLTLAGADAAMFSIVGSELFLNAGASLDFETNASLDVRVEVDDPGLPATPEDSAAMAISITDANEAPTVSLSNLTATLSEDTDTTAAIKVADITLSDDGLGTNNLTLAGADAAMFSIVGSELFLNAGASLDFETNASLDVRVEVDDPGLPATPEDSAAMAISITDANEAPTVSLSNLTATLSEDTDTTAAIKVADITLSDDGLGTNNLTLAGADAAMFSIVGSELFLNAGASLDFETNASLDVRVEVDDPGLPATPEDSAAMAISITDANEAPTVSLSNLTATLSEDTDTTAAIKVADITLSDDGLGTNNLTLAGADAAMFSIVGSELFLNAGASLDFETNASLDVRVEVDDPGLPATPEDSAAMAISITDANEAPTVSLSNLTATLSEDTDTTAAIKVADITLSDDGLGTNNLTLAGADAAMFSIVGSELFLNAGASLDFETNASLDVRVEVDDPGLPATPEDSAAMAISITDANEAPTVSLSNLTATLSEDTDTTAAIKVADITLSDDGLGTNNLTLAGADAAMFSIVGSELFLNAGASLDFETNASLDVRVEVDDPGLPTTPEDSAAMAISITDANEAPSAVDNNASGNEDTLLVGNVLSNDSDMDDDTLTASLVSGPAHGSLTLNADGSFSYTPDADWNGTDSFTYTANDGVLDSNVATVTITVNPVNDAPTVPSSAVTAATEDAAYSYTITTRDVEGDAMTITAPTLPAWLTLVDNGDGTATLSGTPTTADVGDHSVELEISDGALTNIQNFTLTVSGATIDPPTDAGDSDLSGSTNPDPELFEDPDTDDEQDPDTEASTHEDQPQDPVIEDEQAPSPVEEFLATQGSADADDQFVHMQDPQMNDEIIYLTDDDDTDIDSQGRDNDPSITYYDNDLYKDLSLSKYVNINYTAADGPIAGSGDEISIPNFDGDDPNQVDVNGDYDLHRQQLDESFDTELKSQATKAKIVSVTAASFAAGFVSYLLRAGALVANLMSTQPLWRGFDPIVIFSGDKKKKKDRNEIPNTNEVKAETLFDDEEQ